VRAVEEEGWEEAEVGDWEVEGWVGVGVEGWVVGLVVGVWVEGLVEDVEGGWAAALGVGWVGVEGVVDWAGGLEAVVVREGVEGWVAVEEEEGVKEEVAGSARLQACTHTAGLV
jgi:hypothetical protein